MQSFSTHLNPLFFATLCVLLAIYGTIVNPLSAYLFIPVLGFYICCYYRRKTALLTLGCCIFAIAATVLHITIKKQQMQHAQMLLNRQTWEVQGILESVDLMSNFHLKYCYTVRVSYLIKESEQQPFSHKVIIYSNKATSATVGDTIIISNLSFQKKKDAKSDLYLLKQQCIATLFAPYAQIHQNYSPLFSLERLLYKTRQKIFESLQQKITPSVFPLFSSIFFGKSDKKKLAQNNAMFTYWGLSHFLARSGLHLVLFLFIWQFLFSYVPLHLVYKRAILIFLIGTYTLLSWSSISFIRAVVSCILGQVFAWFLLPVNTFQIFIATCFAIIMINPFVIFFLDFQLSFFLTFALIIFNQMHRSL